MTLCYWHKTEYNDSDIYVLFKLLSSTSKPLFADHGIRWKSIENGSNGTQPFQVDDYGTVSIRWKSCILWNSKFRGINDNDYIS